MINYVKSLPEEFGLVCLRFEIGYAEGLAMVIYDLTLALAALTNLSSERNGLVGELK